jgi:hypothetical protein
MSTAFREAPTAIERAYLEQGYELPRGYTWFMVHEARRSYEIGEIYVPVARVPGACVAWGVPHVEIDGRPVPMKRPE